MKEKRTCSVLKRMICILLLILFTANSFVLTARAAGWTRKEILGFFPVERDANYNDTGFLLEHKEIAMLVGNTLADHGYNVDVIYDDEDSTAARKEYILMCTEEQSKTPDFLPMGVNMNVGSKGDVRDVNVFLLTSQWSEKQISRVVPALTAVYEALHGNMTDEMRRNLVIDNRLIQKESGYTAYGNFDGLYYELSFYEEEVSLTMAIQPGRNSTPFAVYYDGPYTLYGAEGYTIRAHGLSMSEQGDLFLEVDLINESKNPLRFHMTHILAGGYDIGTTIFTEVAPGNTKTERIAVDLSLLACAGVGELHDVGLHFRVTDRKTNEILFDYRDFVPVGMVVQADYHKYDATLFRNDKFELSVIGSRKNVPGDTPEIYLMLDNGVYGDVLVETEGNCVVGKQEYNLYALGRTSGYSEGLAVVRPQVSELGKNTKVEFDLQLSSYNYNPMVAGRVTITLDAEGNILKATANMKETAQYKNILEKEY